MGSSKRKSYDVVQSQNGTTMHIVEKTKQKSGKVTSKIISSNVISVVPKARARANSNDYGVHPFAHNPVIARTHWNSAEERQLMPTRIVTPKGAKWQPTLNSILSTSLMPGSLPVSPRIQAHYSAPRSPKRSPQRSPKPKKSSFFTRATARLKKKGVVSALTPTF